MTELVIASNNAGKIKEMHQLLPDLQLLSLREIGHGNEIPEPFHSFEENAFAKADAIYKYCGKNVFADDSGICVSALNGAPGVDSAHFSGTRDDEANLQKLLEELKDKEDRMAYYKAVICLIWNGQTYFFKGICEGRIIDIKRGESGFGYDPIFIPNGYDKTFAELSPDVKNNISHRGKAVRAMAAFIKEQLNEQ